MTSEEKIMLEKSLEMLSAIKKQWDDKELPDDFFVLPYEINEFIMDLKSKINLEDK